MFKFVGYLVLALLGGYKSFTSFKEMQAKKSAEQPDENGVIDVNPKN